MPRKTPFALLSALLWAAFLLPGCASIPDSRTPEQIVEARALERWNLLIDGRVENAYEYLSPGYRAAHQLSAYSRTIRGVGLWKGAAVRAVNCEGQRCVASIDLDIELTSRHLKGPVPVPVTVEEVWIQPEAGGQWWHVPTR